MNRRSFIAGLFTTTAGLALPYEPRRIYSFGEDVGRVVPLDTLIPEETLAILGKLGLPTRMPWGEPFVAVELEISNNVKVVSADWRRLKLLNNGPRMATMKATGVDGSKYGFEGPVPVYAP